MNVAFACPTESVRRAPAGALLAVPLQETPANTDGATERRVRQLIVELDADYFDDRTMAFEELKKIGDPAGQFLEEALDSDKERVRKSAIELLLSMKRDRSLDRIAEIFASDPDRAVRAAAFKYLKEIGRVSEEHLIKGLDLSDTDILLEIVATLKQLNSERAVDPIAELYQRQTHAGVRESALEYLLSIGTPAGKHLVKILESGDRKVREKCLYAMQGSRYVEGIPVFARICRDADESHLRDLAFRCLIAIDGKSEDALMTMLADAKPVVRRKAVDALLEIKGERAVDAVFALVRKDPDEQVKSSAFAYLTGIGRSAEDRLIELLDDVASGVNRKAVIEALGAAESVKAIEHLIAFMRKTDDPLAGVALLALKNIGEKGRDAVLKAAETGRIDRSYAVEVRKDAFKFDLEKVFDELITDSGMTGFYSGQFDRLKAFPARKEIVSLLMDMIKGEYNAASGRALPEGSMRELAIIAIGEIGESDGAQLLDRFLTEQGDRIDDDLRRSAMVSLYKLGKKEQLEKMIDDNRTWIEEHADGDLNERIARYFSTAIVLNRVGRREESAESYRSALDVLSEADQGGTLPHPTVLEYRNAVHYNLACIAAMTGKTGEALQYLGKSIDDGFSDWQWMEKDGDLASIRGEEGYKKLLQRMRGGK